MFLPLIDHWAAASQQRARRNAMIALTSLTQRRAELAEVDEYLASLRRDPEHGATDGAVTG